jgi:hypothetical protein
MGGHADLPARRTRGRGAAVADLSAPAPGEEPVHLEWAALTHPRVEVAAPAARVAHGHRVEPRALDVDLAHEQRVHGIPGGTMRAIVVVASRMSMWRQASCQTLGSKSRRCSLGINPEHSTGSPLYLLD